MPDLHLYCDYWASVLRMPGIVRGEVLRRGLVDLDVFRGCLDRPETRLPGFGYYLFMLVLGPVLIPYRMIQRLASRLHVPLAGEQEAEELLAPFRLALARTGPGRVDVSWRGTTLARDLIDPERPDVVFSVVYPAYKILVAALLAIAVSFFQHWAVSAENLPDWMEKSLFLINFLLLAGLLYLIFRDWITALVAPLPVFVVLGVFSWVPVFDVPFGSLPATMAGLAIAYFLVDAFMVPRGMPPTLYLYSNDPEAEIFPYERGQAPEWLEGRHYWVWRFVSLTPAELHKFWERDWERVEVWVRADGDAAGQVEWVVLDWHFRELWVPYERLVSERRAAGHRAVLQALREDGDQKDAAWVVEVDMNLVGHSPELRGLFMLPLREGWRRARIRQLVRSLRVQVDRDHPRHFRDAVRRLRLTGPDFIADIPEHLRGLALRQLLAVPWRWWRYPRGAQASSRPFLYGSAADGAGEPVPTACEPALQFKARPAGGDAGTASPAPTATARTPASPAS